MKLWIGTSGFQYAEWKGTFYPPDLPVSKMLPFYAERFDTTEINYTFHRIPSAKTIEKWRTTAPEQFRFSLKAPQKVTHFARLRNCGDTIDYFHEVICELGERMGPVLFQLPPSLKRDDALLGSFLEQLPPRMRAAFEFRHASWFDDETFATIAKRNCALCVADTADLQTPVKVTANWAYFRLRREDYTAADIERWATIIRDEARSCKDVFVYFKHEESGIGPKLARQFQQQFAT